ncbi:hypothetical protein Agub_g3899 [Astrephomene gubernaculifera]|uniref:DUF6570 domain-containing protein n=1 Tax=Astrephomene gubernaculifera TaxID=47775 RepID=A0AAD3HJF8_9CHLO|nr:hypothetical protein Agub_g3899 [Astrephomene gubernaculifera]
MRAEAQLPNRTMDVSADGVERFMVCSDCMQALQGGRIPDGALARLDPGDVPPVNQHGHALVPLTHLESLVVGLARPHMRLFVVRQPGTSSWRAVDTLPAALRGHTLAFPNDVPEELQRVVPYAPQDLPSFIQVVLIDAVKDRSDLEAKVRQAPCLKMRGLAIAAWAEWAVHVNPMAQLDRAALQQYRSLGAEPTVPEPLVTHAVATDDPDVAAVMRAAFEGDRGGNARVQQQQEEVEATMGDVHAAGTRAAGSDASGASTSMTTQPMPGAATASGQARGVPITGVLGQPSPIAVPMAVLDGTFGAVTSPATAPPQDGYAGPGVHMLGLDEVEVHHGGAYSTYDPLENSTDPSAIVQRLQHGGVVVSAAGGRGIQPMDEYDPAFFSTCHIDTFPFGDDGARPDGMSTERYAQHLVRRVPRGQFAGNATFLGHIFDVVQKQRTNRLAYVVAQMTPSTLHAFEQIMSSQIMSSETWPLYLPPEAMTLPGSVWLPSSGSPSVTLRMVSGGSRPRLT